MGGERKTSCAIRGARGGNIGHRSPPGSRGELGWAGCAPGVPTHLAPGPLGTASQLARSVFQSIMGSYEGAFSAEPAAGDHPRGGWGGTGSRWLGPRPTRSCQTWLCSGK
jgi:hypothetical protein